MTFKEVAEEWFFTHKMTLTYDYRAKVKGALQHIYRAFGHMEITCIMPREVDTLIMNLAIKNPNTGKPSAKGTLKTVIQAINGVFDFAVMNGIIEANPARFTKLPKNLSCSERRSLNEKEQLLIINTKHRAQTAAMIMMFAGLRRGEIIALKWSDIDFENKQINVNKSAQRIASNEFIVTSGTKNGKNRKVAMPEVLCKYLSESRKTATSDLICPKKDGTLHTPTSWRRMWDSYNNELNYSVRIDSKKSRHNPTGIDKRLDDITAHMLRHTYATMLFNSNVDVKTAAKLLGHSDIETTLKIYTHLEQEREEISIKNFEQYIEKHFKDSK